MWLLSDTVGDKLRRRVVVYGKRLAKAGAGWYEVWKRKQPLRPSAVQCWLGELGDKLASAYAALPALRR